MLRKYFRNVGILGGTELLLRLKGLILVPILTKAFGAVNYGIWAQVAVLVSLLTPLMALGTDSAAIRFLPGQGTDRIKRGFYTIATYYFAVSVLVAVALWMASRPIASTFFDDASNARFVILCGGVTFAGLMTNASRNFYRMTGNARVYAAINIAQSIYTALISVGVALAHGSIFEVVLYGLLADLVLVTLLLTNIIHRFGIALPDFTLLGKFIRFGLPLVPAGYAIWVLNMADRLIITYYGSMQDLGVYSLVYSLGYMFISLIFNPIWLMYPPSAAELYNQGKMDDLNRLFRQSTRLALGLLVPVMTGIGLLGTPLIRLFTTEEFTRGAPLIPLITLGYTFLMMAAYFEVSLGLVGKQILSTINVAIAAIVNLVLNFLLVPTWGIAGAAIATAAGFGTQFALSTWVGSRYVPLMFDWLFFLKTCAASAIMGTVLYFLPAQGIAGLAIAILAGAGVFAIGMVVLKAVSHKEWQGLLQVSGLMQVRQLHGVFEFLGFNTDN